MKRRSFVALSSARCRRRCRRAQNQSATVQRGNAAPAAVKVSDEIYRNDILQTGTNASLAVTFDDETTLSLNANARVVINDFVYEEAGKGNKAVITIARGTVAFGPAVICRVAGNQSFGWFRSRISWKRIFGSGSEPLYEPSHP